VMLFADPVRAFANLRRAATPGAGMCFIVFRSAADNPFMTTAERAAAPLLNLPPRDPHKPGQFAFADRNFVHRILEESGWRDIDIQPLDVPCVFPESELLSYVTRFGPVGLALNEADEQTRAAVVQAVRPAFERYVHGAEVRFTAGCWSIGARG